MGIVFGQKDNLGPVYVEEVTPNGEAEKTGMVEKGDVLIRCSAMVLLNGQEGSSTPEGYGERLYNNWEQTMFDCRNQEFKSVASALKSNSSRMGILDCTMVFQRTPQQPAPAAA